jgi:hypothetical protein
MTAMTGPGDGDHDHDHDDSHGGGGGDDRDARRAWRTAQYAARKKAFGTGALVAAGVALGTAALSFSFYLSSAGINSFTRVYGPDPAAALIAPGQPVAFRVAVTDVATGRVVEGTVDTVAVRVVAQGPPGTEPVTLIDQPAVAALAPLTLRLPPAPLATLTMTVHSRLGTEAIDMPVARGDEPTGGACLAARYPLALDLTTWRAAGASEKGVVPSPQAPALARPDPGVAQADPQAAAVRPALYYYPLPGQFLSGPPVAILLRYDWGLTAPRLPDGTPLGNVFEVVTWTHSGPPELTPIPLRRLPVRGADAPVGGAVPAPAAALLDPVRATIEVPPFVERYPGPEGDGTSAVPVTLTPGDRGFVADLDLYDAAGLRHATRVDLRYGAQSVAVPLSGLSTGIHCLRAGASALTPGRATATRCFTLVDVSPAGGAPLARRGLSALLPGLNRLGADDPWIAPLSELMRTSAPGALTLTEADATLAGQALLSLVDASACRPVLVVDTAAAQRARVQASVGPWREGLWWGLVACSLAFLAFAARKGLEAARRRGVFLAEGAAAVAGGDADEDPYAELDPSERAHARRGFVWMVAGYLALMAGCLGGILWVLRILWWGSH